jgi:pimeloyl-ACP methyl ester carboxylesterase
MKNIFVVSGLGADEKVFHKLVLPGYNLIHVNWVNTEKDESMAAYAKKLLPQITEENPILLGLSLGGMIVVEMSKLIPTRKIISLSSVATHEELPLHFKLAGTLKINKVLPIHLFSKANPLAYWFFGVYAAEDKVLLDKVLEDLDPDFLYWALNAIFNWGNTSIPKNIKRIHGANDKVLPRVASVKYDEYIKEGSHLMVLDKSELVSFAILNCLNID